MSQLTMYQSIINSPQTTLASNITNAQTSIDLVDASVLPTAPNLMSISDGTNIETILYTGKSSNTITGCTRGFQGNAFAFQSSNSKVARVFTAYDHDTFINNISDLSNTQTKQLTTTVDFGSSGYETFVQTVVTGQSWVTSGSIITATLFGEDSGDRSVEDGIIEGIVLSISNLVAGVGFTVNAYAPEGSSGVFKINIIGR